MNDSTHSLQALQVAIQRMIGAGANVMTWMAVAGEWQREHARVESDKVLAKVLVENGGAAGIAFLWEQHLLNTPVPSTEK